MNKYLIIDKNTMSRESVVALVYEFDEKSLVNESDSIKDVCSSTEVHQTIDFIIVNPYLKYIQQTEYISNLRESFTEAKILIISHYTDRDFVETILESGAQGVLTMGSSRTEIISALRALKSNQLYVGHSVLKKRQETIINQSSSSEIATKQSLNHLNQKLTSRQRQVLDYITKGYANKLIAYELGVSEGTIKLHVSSILRALKVTNRTEAAMRAGQIMSTNVHYV